MGRESNVMLYFNEVCQVAAPVGRQTTSVSLSSPELLTAIYDYDYRLGVGLVSWCLTSLFSTWLYQGRRLVVDGFR